MIRSLRFLAPVLFLVPLAAPWFPGASPPDPHGSTASTLRVSPSASDPFTKLAPPTPDPSATPYVFETGPHVPKPANVVNVPFPPAETPKAAKTPAPPELKVLRTQPSGKATAGDASIGAVTATFNQPMIPLAALSDVKEQSVPMVIEPLPKGRFRWLGTTTVSFEPEGRMPFATQYVAKIPAGAKSALGKTLATEVTWRFETPRPTVIAKFPDAGNHHATPETVIAISFDQRVDAAKVAEKTSLQGPAGRVSVDVVPASEWAAIKGAPIGSWDPERSVVLRPRSPLEKDSAYRVEIASGLPSAEGPLVTLKKTTWSFRTYAPLKVLRVQCGWEPRACPPNASWTIELNNQLDGSPMEEKIALDPKVDDLLVQQWSNVVTLQGSFKAASKYELALLPEVTDIYGQKLGKRWTGTLAIGDALPQLELPGHGVVVVESKGNRTLALSVQNVFDVKLRMVKVGPGEVRKYEQLAQQSPWFGGYYRNDKDPLAGVKVDVSRKLTLTQKKNEAVRVGIPLDEALKGETGLVYVDLYSPDLRKGGDDYSPTRRGVLVQVTDVGLAVKYDPEKILALATSIEEGKPLANVDITIVDRLGKTWWSGKTGADGLVRIPGPRDHQPVKNAPLHLQAKNAKDFSFLSLTAQGARGGWVRGYSYEEKFDESVLRSFFFTDRGIYRPGETVHLKGMLRSFRNRAGGGLSALPESAKKVIWQVRSPRGEEIAKGEAPIGAFDSVSFDIAIPRGADLGSYYLSGSLDNAGGLGATWMNTSFQVQEYRTPEYEVKVDTGAGPWLFGQTLKGAINGKYYFGAPMADAEVSWTLTRSAGVYSPPNNDGFSFGDRRWRPWWLYGNHYDVDYDESPRRRGYRYGYHREDDVAAQGTGRTDAKGVLEVSALLERKKDDESKGPGSFTLEAQVFDVNRQAVAGRSTFVVHPAETYVGMRITKTVIREKERVPLDVIAAKIDGTRVETQIAVRMIEESWKQKTEKQEDGTWKTSWTKEQKEVATCRVSTGKEPKPCEMKAPRPGHFLLEGTAKDAAGREAFTVVDVYVYGEGAVTWRTDNANQIELVPDKLEYAVGDLARVLVKSPFPRGEGLVSFEADGILDARRVSLDGAASTIEIPITEKHVPNLHVSLTLARGRLTAAELPPGASPQEDIGRPSWAAGEAVLKVSKAPKTLTVKATPSRATAGPGETIDLDISLADASGKGVRGDAAVMLVDEGVLALLAYETPDPLAAFWPDRAAGAVLDDLRNRLLKQEKELQLALKARGRNGDAEAADATTTVAFNGAPAGGALAVSEETRTGASEKKAPAPARAMRGESDKNMAGENAPAITARTEFASTAFWAGAVETDANGKAKLQVKLPDNLTTFRIMVVAADAGDRFGKTDGQVTVRKRVLVRPSLPRFLNFGDSFEAAVVVHNETGRDGNVELVARAANLAIDESARKAVFLKTGESAEVRWKAHALATGTARVQFGAFFDGSADAAEISIPVKLPATSEAFATYGVTENSIAQPLIVPSDVIPEFGGFSMQTSSTALTTLGDAVAYLYDYPYECLEQTASRILPIFAMKDVIKDFKLPGDGHRPADGRPWGPGGEAPGNQEDPVKKADRLSKDGIARILALQNWDGGFRFWPESPKSDPWISGYATFVLLRGKEAGYAVPQQSLNRAKGYLQQHGLNPPKEWGEYWRRAVQTQAVLVLTEMGEKPKKVADDLYAARADLPMFSRAMLMVSMKRMHGKTDARTVELLRLIDNAAVETPGAAHFAEKRTESRALRLLMHSEARTDAIVLWAMIEARPEDPLIPKVVKGLNDSRVKGRWSTTQENAWVLLAMGRYYDTFEKQVPEFTARAWLEDRYMGETAFAGRTMDIKRIDVPMAQIASMAGQKKDFVVAKDGPGRLYYRLGLSYAPKSLTLPAEEQGFTVSRTYEGVDDPKDVTRNADGTWIVKAGTNVKVRMTIVVPDRRYYAAVVDPLPAGLEAVNATLATTARSIPRAGVESAYDTWSWYAPWVFNHVQMRDDRVEIFADDLPAGVYEYVYIARATTFGDYVVPPLKAEEMYAPEVFGRNATMRLSVR